MDRGTFESASIPTCDHSHAKIVPFLHLILCLPVVIDFCLKERYRQSSERSSGAWCQFYVWRKADSTQTSMSVWSEGRRWPHFIYTRRLIYLPTTAAQRMHRSHLESAYNHPASLKRKVRIISRTVDIIKCWCLVFRCYIQWASSIAEAYHPLVQMLWEVFKGLWALERGNSAAFDLCCYLWWRCTGSAMALQRSTNNRSSRPPPTFIPTAPQPCLGTMDTKGWGCYSDTRSILPLAGPGSPCTLVNHLPNNEPYFTPSPLLSSPVFFPHCAIRMLFSPHKQTTYLAVKVPPLFLYPPTPLYT